ncbi:hypothetical protein M8C21_010495 [Ambrosia artemisiifolia]|uniref:Uncharacterized protein n=1 Tax=Ambrosia artemisiifolia TaxID=4212 RepID=A0AAD5BKV3_AMBAR|nr:hypothetical protein M8C21_010495 [Ambrosia artemisiifolia]
MTLLFYYHWFRIILHMGFLQHARQTFSWEEQQDSVLLMNITDYGFHVVMELLKKDLGPKRSVTEFGCCERIGRLLLWKDSKVVKFEEIT